MIQYLQEREREICCKNGVVTSVVGPAQLHHSINTCVKSAVGKREKARILVLGSRLNKNAVKRKNKDNNDEHERS